MNTASNEARKSNNAASEQDNITPAEFYQTNGYIVFRSLFADAEIDSLLAMVETELVPFTGKLSRIRSGYGRNKISDNGLITNAVQHLHLSRNKALSGVVQALRQLVLHPRLAKALQSLDGDSTHVLAQTIMFFTCPKTGTHIDSFSLDTWPRGKAYTCWIALEDITPEAGPPYIYPGQTHSLLMEFPRSHEIWRHKNPSAAANEIYTKRLEAHLAETGAKPYTLQLKKGDVVMWSSLTPHGSNAPFQENISRKSIQALYWPASMEYGTYIMKTREKLLDHNGEFKIRQVNRKMISKILGFIFSHIGFISKFVKKQDNDATY